MNVDGSAALRKLTDERGENEGPVWSPDGERIAFEKAGDIWVMNADGTEQRRLTHGGEPVWSPTGEKIAFTGGSPYGNTIVVVNDDGSEERTLFAPGELGGDGGPAWTPSGPAWSPDGSQDLVDPVQRKLRRIAIWVMDADGGNAHKLQAGPYSEPHGLDWAAARD